VFAEYISKKIKETKAKNNSLLAALAKIITTVIVILIALKQIGIRVDVAENSFLIILGGVMLCFAIAFGLALKDEAKNIVKEIRKRI
jgi:small-conductance mechanosensitive channel